MTHSLLFYLKMTTEYLKVTLKILRGVRMFLVGLLALSRRVYKYVYHTSHK